jgi:hypothetical protein
VQCNTAGVERGAIETLTSVVARYTEEIGLAAGEKACR